MSRFLWFTVYIQHTRHLCSVKESENKFEIWKQSKTQSFVPCFKACHVDMRKNSLLTSE